MNLDLNNININNFTLKEIALISEKLNLDINKIIEIIIEDSPYRYENIAELIDDYFGVYTKSELIKVFIEAENIQGDNNKNILQQILDLEYETDLFKFENGTIIDLVHFKKRQ